MKLDNVHSTAFLSDRSIVVFRWLATMVDYLLIIGLYMFYFYALGPGHTGLALFVCAILTVLYYVVLEGLTGYTLGKAIFRIKVVNQDGNVPGMLKSLIRTLFRLLEINPLLFGGIIAGVVALTSPRKQRIGDMLANTYVLKCSELEALFASQAKEPEELQNTETTFENPSFSDPNLSDNTKQFLLEFEKSYFRDTEKHPHKLKPVITIVAVASFFVVSFVWALIYSVYFNTDLPSSGNTVTGKDGSFHLSLPSGWGQYTDSKNSDAILSIRKVTGECALSVVKIARKDYADDMSTREYCNLKIEELKKLLTDGQNTDTKDITVNNYPALQFEFTGTENRYKVQYLFTMIDTENDIYQIAGWASQSGFYSFKTDLSKIINSFSLANSKVQTFIKYPNQKGNME